MELHIERGPGCAICDGMGGMPVNGTWTICPDCSQWTMGAEHWRDINNRSVIMVDPEKLVAGIRRMIESDWQSARDRTLSEGYRMRHDALVEQMQRDGGRLEAAEAVIAAVRQLRDACHAGISQDDLVMQLSVVFGALTDYDIATGAASDV